MADPLTKEKRSRLMSNVRSADTKPEWILRCGLHRLGFRYRLRESGLPGKPDLVFPKFRAVVFVHGCYWHRHEGCRHATKPKSNVDFWEAKFARNMERDRRTRQELESLGWRVLAVWECDLLERTVETVRSAADWLRQSPGCWDASDAAVLERKELLGVAEGKVRYRIDSYSKKPGPNDSGATEEKKP